MSGKKRIYQRVLRLMGAVLVLAALGTVAVLGWQWQARLKVERIDVTGMHHADRPALLELARVDTSMRLFSVDPALVADRVQRHPWVRSAQVTRLPTGTLRIRVRERTPVVLVLSEGTPSHYLDAEGFQMPLAGDAVYDVPLLQGLQEAYHPVRRIEGAGVRALLEALSDHRLSALVSELEYHPASGEVWLYTVPTGAHGSVPVRLGHTRFEEKLRHLEAFWRQAVATRSSTTFEVIDLRFEGQVVTRETFDEESNS